MIAYVKMKIPKALWKDAELDVTRYEITSFDGEKIECLLMAPKDFSGKIPCLIYIHGGGFVLAAADYHYKNAMRYAKEVGCKVLFVNYRLAPTHPHPIFFEDCYAAFCWAYEHADNLGIDIHRMGVGGDSAGSTLAVGVCMMAKDRKHYVYYSPVEAESLDGLPPAYIETAEFDCLHDDGILYAKLLQEAGISVQLNETKGTMHGFDIVMKAPTTLAAMEKRIEFMRRMI